MYLNEEDKKRIAEEEAYREKVRAEESYREHIRRNLNKTAWWKPKGTGGWIGLIFLVSIILLSVVVSRSTQNIKEGTVKSYDENISIGDSVVEGKKMYIATFKKNLPQDEKIMGENMGKVIGYTFGDIGFVDMKTFEKDGIVYFSIKAKNGKSYTVLLLKDENDMIFGMNYWQE